MGMLIQIVLPASLAVIMFSLGLGLTPDDFRQVLKTPKALFACFFSQIVLLPVVALVIVVAFRLEGMLAVGMMIIALCPGGIPSNMLTRFARGDVALSISLTAVNSLIAVATIPVLVKLVMLYFTPEQAQSINVTRLSLAVFFITILPAVLGMLARKVWPLSVDRLEAAFNALSTILFFLIVAIATIDNWTVLSQNFWKLGPAVILLIIVMLLAGGLLPMAIQLPGKQARTIAIETATQNATMGVTVSGLALLSSESLSAICLPSAFYGVIQYLLLAPLALLLLRHMPDGPAAVTRQQQVETALSPTEGRSR